MAADEKLKFTKKWNNFETVHPICTNFGMHHPLHTRNKNVVPECGNSESKMAAGRHIEICKNFNNSRSVCPIRTKFRT